MDSKTYHSLKELQQDIQNEKLELNFNLVEMEDTIDDIPLPERLHAFQMIHQYFLDRAPKDSIPLLEKRLNDIIHLIHLYENDTALLFEINKTYEVSDWKGAVWADTGEHCEPDEIQSSKTRILENSKFKNAYAEFVLRISNRIFQKDESGIPFIHVQPINGKAKEHSLYLRTDKLKIV